jgi:AcrR family transcriptional regulator
MAQNQPPRGRPRDPDLEGRILAAAMDTYARTGWAAFTMDAVARRAGVGKSALYLRWPTKEKLLIDALETHSTPVIAADTGSFEKDARVLATALMRYFLDPTGWVAVRVAVDAAVETIDFAQFHERIVGMHSDAATGMVQRAIDRGDLPRHIPVQPFVETLFGAILMHALALKPADREDARANPEDHVTPLVDFVLTGIPRDDKPMP